MLGGMLAGHDQCGGEMIAKPDGKKYKSFYGMSSDTAMKKHAGGVADYRYVDSSHTKFGKNSINVLYLFCSVDFRAAEGKTVEVPYKGDVESTVLDVLGGLRSACTYTGASKLRELPKRATFIRCTQQVNTVYSNLA